MTVTIYLFRIHSLDHVVKSRKRHYDIVFGKISLIQFFIALRIKYLHTKHSRLFHLIFLMFFSQENIRAQRKKEKKVMLGWAYCKNSLRLDLKY